MDNKGTKDPYLSELDAIDELEAPTQHEGEAGAEDPTRIDLKAPPAATRAQQGAMPPPAAGEESTDGSEAAPYEELSETLEGPVPVKELLDLSPDINVPLVIVMGRKNYTVKDLLSLRMGQVMDLDRAPLEPVDLVAGGRVIGKGELVDVEGKLGVRILKLLK